MILIFNFSLLRTTLNNKLKMPSQFKRLWKEEKALYLSTFNDIFSCFMNNAPHFHFALGYSNNVANPAVYKWNLTMCLPRVFFFFLGQH